MSPLPECALVEAINAFDYPPITFDFLEDRELRFPNMRELEQYIQSLLHASDASRVKNGLSGVLYWGFYRIGFRDRRVDIFREHVTDQQLRRASEAFQQLGGPALMSLKRLGLPQFTNMAFITKLRTFLDPEHYCVLDSKIARLKPLATRLKRQPTCIPVNEHNEQVYRWWIGTCQSLASRVQMKPAARPVDVERGLFNLLERDKQELAEQILLIVI